MKKILFLLCLVGLLYADVSDTIRVIDKRLETIRQKKEQIMADYYRLEGAEAILIQLKKDLQDLENEKNK